MSALTPNLFDAPKPAEKAETLKAETRKEDAAARPGAVLEYTPIGERALWQVERAEELWVRFRLADRGSTESHPTSERTNLMRSIHEGLREFPLWLVVRRLFGIAPVIPPAGAHPDDFRVWSAAELCSHLGVTPELLEAQIEAARLAWEGYQRRASSDAPPAVAPVRVRHGEGELPFTDAELLARFNFPKSMFELRWQEGKASDPKEGSRGSEEERAEQAWFCARVRELEKMLSEQRGGAATLARRVLLNELDLRRLELDMVQLRPSSNAWDALRVRKNQLEETVEDQHEKLTAMFPDANVANKVSFRQSLADLVLATQHYYGSDDNRLYNKICTVTEMEWQMRTSVQLPAARLRMGQQLALVAAMEGLWDPAWRPSLSHAFLKRVDAAARASLEAVRAGEGEQIIDLEKEGDEFPDFTAQMPKAETLKAEN